MTNEEARSNLEKLLHLYDDGMIDFSIIRESIKVAIDALEKQIPKKTGKPELGISKKYPVIIPCGNCYVELADRMWRYCPYCGQAIDWTGGEG